MPSPGGRSFRPSRPFIRRSGVAATTHCGQTTVPSSRTRAATRGLSERLTSHESTNEPVLIPAPPAVDGGNYVEGWLCAPRPSRDYWTRRVRTGRCARGALRLLRGSNRDSDRLGRRYGCCRRYGVAARTRARARARRTAPERHTQRLGLAHLARSRDPVRGQVRKRARA